MKPKTAIYSFGVVAVGSVGLAVVVKQKRHRAVRRQEALLDAAEARLAGDAAEAVGPQGAGTGADWGEFAEALGRSDAKEPISPEGLIEKLMDWPVMAMTGNGSGNPPVDPWAEPRFREPVFRTVDDEFVQGNWREVTPPGSPAVGLPRVAPIPGAPVAYPPLPAVGFGTGSHSIPDPWPVGVRVPTAPPLASVRRRSNYRLARARAAITSRLREEEAWGRFMRKVSHDAASGGRAKVHIANDPIGLHDELSRSGRLGSSSEIVDGPAIARGDLSSLRSPGRGSSLRSSSGSTLSRVRGWVSRRVLGSQKGSGSS